MLGEKKVLYLPYLNCTLGASASSNLHRNQFQKGTEPLPFGNFNCQPLLFGGKQDSLQQHQGQNSILKKEGKLPEVESIQGQAKSARRGSGVSQDEAGSGRGGGQGAAKSEDAEEEEEEEEEEEGDDEESEEEEEQEAG